MSDILSPFLHRDEERPRQYRYFGNPRRDRDEADRYKGALLLEKLRYQQWVRNGKIGAIMQPLGDWGRSHGQVAVMLLKIILYTYLITRLGH